MKILNNYTLEEAHLFVASIAVPFFSSDLSLTVAQETDTQNHHEQEIWFIKSGTGIIKSGSYTQTVVTGDLIFLESFEHHSILNIGNSELSFVAFWYADWLKINEDIFHFNAKQIVPSHTPPLVVMHDEKPGEISQLFLALSKALTIPFVNYAISNPRNYDINKLLLELKQHGQIFSKEISYPYDEQTQKFIILEELSGKCQECDALIQTIACHFCGHFHREFQLLEPRNKTTGSFLTTRPLHILYLEIDKSFLKQIELLYTQADDYSSKERILLHKYNNDTLDFPLTCFAQSGQSINISMGLLPHQGPLKIIPEIYHCFTAALFYNEKSEENKGVIFIGLSQFYVYAIIFQKIVLHYQPSSSLFKVRLDTPYPFRNVFVDNKEFSFLLTHLHQLNEQLQAYSFIVPEPGQWINKDILFIQDVQMAIKRFFYFANIDNFNAIELCLIRKKLMFEISEYFTYLKQIDAQINKRHHRTALTLYIYAIQWLLWFANIFLDNHLNLDNFDYRKNFDLNYGKKLNPFNLIHQLSQILTLNEEK
ncbi:class I tRNA ligase family protein [Legionella drancourtii]|uniref:Methionyl/Leucyl tRNA synthetase domain-containing protein n=1 Tax=Legionella drancourtii LLAP12 TaxID=658187 RepID=G9EN83_9GAMM|nr:class I tRNA ligase family protein [Legionella drancourtii]EHL31244.1 hypothetical protein LDG_6705 [Legionella drancourtii LLAP12]